MRLKIKLQDRYFKPGSIANGKLIKDFFTDLSTNIFIHSYKYSKKHKELTKEPDFPLLYVERNLYSIVASSINKITPAHLSEWGFVKNNEKNLEKDRRADFWCLYKPDKNTKTLNYFIELKKGSYNLNKKSNKELTKKVQDDFIDLQKQLKTLKNIKPEWEGKEAAYLGLMIIHSEFPEGQEHYTEKDIVQNIKELIDNRSNF